MATITGGLKLSPTTATIRVTVYQPVVSRGAKIPSIYNRRQHWG